MDTIHWFLDGKEDIRLSYYLAKDWHLPDLHFKEYDWDNEIDHDWHEFASIEETNEPVTLKISIDDDKQKKLQIIKKGKQVAHQRPQRK